MAGCSMGSLRRSNFIEHRVRRSWKLDDGERSKMYSPGMESSLKPALCLLNRAATEQKRKVPE